MADDPLAALQQALMMQPGQQEQQGASVNEQLQAPSTPSTNTQLIGGEFSRQQQQANQPPQPGTRPNFMNLIDAITGKGEVGKQPSPLARPLSRADEFHTFVGNFLNSFAQGMAASGHGPGAFGRGLGASMQAPYQRQLQQYELGQKQQAQQSRVGLEQAEAERMRAQSQMTTITLPGGQTMQLPASQATEILKTQLQGQSKVDAAKVNRYSTSPFGLFDRQTGKLAPASGGGVGATIKMTKEMADSGQFGPGAAQLIDKDVKISDLNGMEKAASSGYGFVQGAEGPAREQKVGPTGTLGLGSPAENAVAKAKLQIQKNQFDRDTFGTIYGKSIPSSLIDDQGQVLGWKSPAAPTSSIKTQAQQASDLSQLFAKVRTKMAEANKAGMLGPTSGRVNEFLTGTVGADNPMFNEVRALGSLTASGILKAHFGAKGGQQMYDHFEALFNTGKMTYGDLDGALKGFQTFMDQYASRVKTAGTGGSSKVNDLAKKYGGVKP